MSATNPGITSIPALDAAEVAAEAAYWKGRADQVTLSAERAIADLKAAVDRHPAGKGLVS